MTGQHGGLRILPFLDSAEMAAVRRRELDIPRDIAAALGGSAVEAAEKGYYFKAGGEDVDWKNLVDAARMAKQSIAPDVSLTTLERNAFPETRVQVANETTLGASLRLVEGGHRPLALNFANGIHPGGGFLHGARAQEEVLCRSSALYQTLVNDRMYEEHRKRPQPDSTDWAVYSPDVPVFRKDDGTELDEPWLLSFISCAAPVASRIGQPESGDLLQRRIHRVLAIAEAFGTRLSFWAHGVAVLSATTRAAQRSISVKLWRTILAAHSPTLYSRSQIGHRSEDSSALSVMFLRKLIVEEIKLSN